MHRALPHHTVTRSGKTGKICPIGSSDLESLQFVSRNISRNTLFNFYSFINVFNKFTRGEYYIGRKPQCMTTPDHQDRNDPDLHVLSLHHGPWTELRLNSI